MNMDWKKYLNKNGCICGRHAEEIKQLPEYIELQKTYYWCKSVSELYYCLTNNITIKPTCYCGNKVEYVNEKKIRYREYCSCRCSTTSPKTKEKTKSTNIEKYGHESHNQCKEIKQKKIKISQEKFGCDYPWQNEEVKKTKEKVYLQNYGETNPNKVKSVRNKIKKTHNERYGCDYPYQSEEIKQKYRDTCNKRYGRDSSQQKHISLEHLNNINSIEYLSEQHYNLKKPLCKIAEENGVSDTAIKNRFYMNNMDVKYFNSSQPEQDLFDYIRSLDPNLEIIRNDREQIKPLELDIYIPSKRVAIEYNGLYYHSYDRPETSEERRKHQNKCQICDNNNIQLIQIFESEWIQKQDIVKSMLRSKLGYINRIYARNCLIKEVSQDDSKRFLEKYHIQSQAPAQIRLGLFYQDELIAVQTFKKGYYSKKFEWELSRFACKANIQIVGGASKLFNYFIQKYDPKSIITFSDRRYSVGNLYKTIGFTFFCKTDPNYYYFIPGVERLFHRALFQKHLLPRKLANFDINQTEHDNMFNNGYRRIWDAGNIKWVWYKKMDSEVVEVEG